jgi:hypothetical protein
MGLTKGEGTVLKRLCVLSLLAWSMGGAAADAQEYDTVELVDYSTWVLASEAACSLSLDPTRIRVFVALHQPDMNWTLFQFQVDARRKHGVSRLDADQLDRHCQKMRQMVQAAGWGG